MIVLYRTTIILHCPSADPAGGQPRCLPVPAAPFRTQRRAVPRACLVAIVGPVAAPKRGRRRSLFRAASGRPWAASSRQQPISVAVFFCLDWLGPDQSPLAPAALVQPRAGLCQGRPPRQCGGESSRSRQSRFGHPGSRGAPSAASGRAASR